jgi:AraC family transcriptional regulator of adaptative response / DNA-3-methyladenine glycosylase II
MLLDEERCYAAARSRDARFDGWFFIAVRTTGIYCRPSCPAITPKRANVEFHPTAAAAQQRGFRACKRCRPDASPGSPEWNLRGDVVGRAMRLIADGAIERDGVAGLARQVGYSERQLNRVFNEELGAGPLAIARARRAQAARVLIETTSLPITDIAYAAGFGSVRQFNDTVREVFATTPSRLRRAADGLRPVDGPNGSVSLRLPARRPFGAAEVLGFVGARAVPGIETWDGSTYRRSLALPLGHGVATVRAADDHLVVELTLQEWADLGVAIQRLRRLFDLDADPVAVDAHLSTDPALERLVGRAPGRRAPASTDPYETAVRAVVGQQVSVAGARTVTGRIVAAGDERLAVVDAALTHVFPAPSTLAALGEGFSMPSARADTIRRLASAVAVGELVLDAGADAGHVREGLLAMKGIGPWTAEYVVMRGLGDPDTFLATDLGVRHALAQLGVHEDRAAAWSPWRSYAVHHLWASLGPPRTTTSGATTAADAADSTGVRTTTTRPRNEQEVPT